MLPILALAIAIAIALIVGLISLGVWGTSAVLHAVLSTPLWAIVIIILLVLILGKLSNTSRK